MKLEAEVQVSQGDHRLSVRLEARAEEVLAVIGPNGAGKTTLLRALAGLVPLAGGRVSLDGVVLEDAAAGIRVPAEGRAVGFVFQEPRLFEHMSVLENVAFGLRARRLGRREARARAALWLERVGLSAQAGHRPGQLSGGQAQRAGLARALVGEPRWLLLDEPLAAVDSAGRLALRHLVREELRRYPGVRILVTHDPAEAATLADRLLVLEDGAVVQEGALSEVTTRPRSAWVATMVGLNVLEGHAGGGVVSLSGGGSVAVATDLVGAVLLSFRPSAVALHRGRPEGSARNVWAVRVEEIHFHSDRVRVRLSGPADLVAEVTRSAAAELELVSGSELWASVKATEVEVYPA